MSLLCFLPPRLQCQIIIMIVCSLWCWLHQTAVACITLGVLRFSAICGRVHPSETVRAPPLGLTPGQNSWYSVQTRRRRSTSRIPPALVFACFTVAEWKTTGFYFFFFLCLPRWAVAVDVLIFCLRAARKNLKHFTVSKFTAAFLKVHMHRGSCADPGATVAQHDA